MPVGRRSRSVLVVLAVVLASSRCAPTGAVETATEARALEGEAAVRVVEPAPCAVLESAGGPVNLQVRFTVAGWAYPSANKGVAILLDGGEPFAVVQGVTPVLLAGVAPGRHRVAACPVTRSSAAGAWQPLATCACDVVTVDVALTGCAPLVEAPVTGDPRCDPRFPATTCCLDLNPCSVEACDDAGLTPICTFASVAPDCCLADLDCPADHFCHLVDDPTTNSDDTLALHRCAPCSACPAAGATCPTVCGACPACEAEGVCGGGLCPALPPVDEPNPEAVVEATPDLAAEAAEGREVASEAADDEGVAGEASPAETGPDAPGYTVDVSLDGDAVDAAGTEAGSCSMVTARPAPLPLALLLILSWITLGRGRRTTVGPQVTSDTAYTRR